MKKTDLAVQLLLFEIENKQILEAACGRAEFTSSTSVYAQSVSLRKWTECRKGQTAK